MSTDATTISITTDALAAGQYTSAALTIGNITDNVLTSYSVTPSSNARVTVGTLTTTNPEFATLTLSAPANANLTQGVVTADSATAVTLTVDAANQSTVTMGAVSMAAAAVTLKGTIGDQVNTDAGTNSVTAKSFVSSNFVVGAGLGTSSADEALPAIVVGATTGTVGTVTIEAGVASYVEQSIATGTAPASIGAITVKGSGSVEVIIADVAASDTTANKSNYGAISASQMTSSQSVLRLTATGANDELNVTGGAGADVFTLSAGVYADTITGGKGADTFSLIAGGGGSDLLIFAEETTATRLLQYGI